MNLVSLMLIVSLATPGVAKPEWREWAAGVKEASRSKKLVLVDVYTDWCGWCRRMDRDVYARPEVRSYLSKKYVAIKLNAESDAATTHQGRPTTTRAVASSFRIDGYPTTLFLRPNGEHLVTVPGYVPPERFMVLLRYLAEGQMDRGVSFEDFEKRSR